MLRCRSRRCLVKRFAVKGVESLLSKASFLVERFAVEGIAACRMRRCLVELFSFRGVTVALILLFASNV